MVIIFSTCVQMQNRIASHKATVDELQARLLRERSQSEATKLSSQLAAKEVSPGMHRIVLNT